MSLLKIGITSCMFHPDPERAIFKGKRLLYMEESMFHWVSESGAFAFLLPTAPSKNLSLEEMVDNLDGVLLSGGVDVAPGCYGEEPMKPEWGGDRFRDDYEIEIIKHALELDKPILGICRGAQLLNVALEGTMYQDISTQVPGSLVHRDWDLYDQNFHQLVVEPNSGLAKLYPGLTEAKINSVHHQGIDKLGKGLKVEARSKEDGIIEAIRLASDKYALGIQWHPEFQDPKNNTILDRAPIMTEFLTAVREKRA
jgi:putative glutamine amidotransferase